MKLRNTNDPINLKSLNTCDLGEDQPLFTDHNNIMNHCAEWNPLKAVEEAIGELSTY